MRVRRIRHVLDWAASRRALCDHESELQQRTEELGQVLDAPAKEGNNSFGAAAVTLYETPNRVGVSLRTLLLLTY